MYWQNFSAIELQCSCCGKSNPNPEFKELMDKVQILRDRVGFPLKVTSAYRCANHPIEAEKDKPGSHNLAAIDLAVSKAEAYKVLYNAMELGFTGIGVQQKGKGRFIHLDLRGQETIWSY